MAWKRAGLGVLNLLKRLSPRVQSVQSVLDADLRRPLDHATSLIRERLGAFDGDFGDTFSHHRDVAFDAMYRQGERDAGRSGSRNAYIAGSGNTQSTALQRARTAARVGGGHWTGVTGGS